MHSKFQYPILTTSTWQILQGTEIPTWCVWIQIRFLPLPCQPTVAVLWGCSCIFAGRLCPTSGIASAVCNWKDVARYPNFCRTIFANVYPVRMHFVLSVGSENPKAADISEVGGGWQRTRKELASHRMCAVMELGVFSMLSWSCDNLLLVLGQLVAACGVTVQEAAHKCWLRDNVVKLLKYLRSHSHLNSSTVHCQERKIWGLFSMLFWKMVNFLLLERLSNPNA